MKLKSLTFFYLFFIQNLFAAVLLPQIDHIDFQDKHHVNTHYKFGKYLNELSFAIEGSRLFFKPTRLPGRDHWKPFPMPVTPVTQVLVDDDSIVVTDQFGQVYFGKLDMINYSILETSISTSAERQYTWVYKEFDPKWSSEWYNLPIVCRLINRVSEQRLFIPEHRAISMSRKGFFTKTYTDPVGKGHPDPFIGVDSLFLLTKDGRRLFFADPWLNNGFKNEITMPEDGTFEAENMDGSGSTLMLIKREFDPSGQLLVTVYYRYADFDSIGNNPLLPATFNLDNIIPLIRILPGQNWIGERLLLPKGAFASKKIEVKQTGRGSFERRLKIAGFDSLGRKGFYYKDVKRPGWNFIPVDSLAISDEDIALTSNPYPVPPIIKDYNLSSKSGSRLKDFRGTIQLKKFMPFGHGISERGLNTKLVLTTPSGKSIQLILFARRGLHNLLNANSTYIKWTLVLPKELYQNKDPEIKGLLKEILGHSKSADVDVFENADSSQVSIQSKGLLQARLKFKWDFVLEDPRP